ncbi:MAG: MFS transporter [Chloroflexi bacterium]|nr:MFS transporter [Chloroflexota bacterium]
MNDASEADSGPSYASSIGGGGGAAALPGATPSSTASSREADAAAPTSGWRYTFSSLSNRNFFFLWLGMLAMMGGMQMQMLARGYLVYDITGSAGRLGLVAAGSAIPMLTLALFGGAIADRMDRKLIIQLGQTIGAVLALAVALMIIAGYVTWQLLFLASVIQGAMFAFMMPARQAIIPQLVGKKNLSNAMALNAAAMSAMTLTAPAVAGGLYAFAGPHNVYFVIAVLGGLSVVFTTFVKMPENVEAVKSKRPVMSDIGEGLVYIWHSPIVRILLVMGLATTLLAMPFRFLMPVFVVDVYRLGPDSMGLLVAVMGGGSLVGSLFIATIGQWRRGLLLILGSFASAIALFLLAIFPFYFAAAAIMLLLGLGDAGRRTINQSLIMEEVEDRYRGRVMSVFMMNFGLMPLGVLPTGFLIDYLGPQFAIGILAVLLFGVSAYMLITQKQLREMS